MILRAVLAEELVGPVEPSLGATFQICLNGAEPQLDALGPLFVCVLYCMSGEMVRSRGSLDHNIWLTLPKKTD